MAEVIKQITAEFFFKFWLRSVAQIITPSGACYNLRNGTQPKLKRLNSELIMEALTYTLYLIQVEPKSNRLVLVGTSTIPPDFM